VHTGVRPRGAANATRPLPGTTKLHRLEENLDAANVELPADDLREIEGAVSKIPVQEDRYPPYIQARVGR
jgi:aryl-alcohol dehydrogenase-like predicted oxidoreductase